MFNTNSEPKQTSTSLKRQRQSNTMRVYFLFVFNVPVMFLLSRTKGDFGHVPSQAELQGVSALSHHRAAHSQCCCHLLSFRRRRAGSWRSKGKKVRIPRRSAWFMCHLYQKYKLFNIMQLHANNDKLRKTCRLLNISLFTFKNMD